MFIVGIALLLSLVAFRAWADTLALDPRRLPGGHGSLAAVQAELERLSVAGDAPRLEAAPAGQGVALPGVDDADDLSQGLVGSRDPFAFAFVDDARRLLLIGPPGQVEAAQAQLTTRVERRQQSLDTLALSAGELPESSAFAAMDAALVLALPEHDEATQRRLFARLREARLPSLALTDAQQVERGALLSVGGAVDAVALHRHLALRLHDLAGGRKPEPLESHPQRERPWLNLATVGQVDWSPPFDLLSQAHLVAEPETSETQLTLEQAVGLALADNLGLAVARQNVEVESHAVDLARSRFLPNLYLEATGRIIDANRARAGLGQSPQRRVSGGAVLEQLLFSEPAMAGIAIAESLDRSRRAQLEAETLDLALSVASEFLDMLRLEARREVLVADLELARGQRDSAKRALDAGASGRGELARFEAEVAQARERLETVVAEHERLRLALNRRLGRDSDATLSPAAPDIEAPRWLGGDARFQRLLASRDTLTRWQDALVASALAESSELQALAARQRAAERELASRRRAFWVPQVGIEARYSHEISRDGVGDRAPWESSSALVQGVVTQVQQAGVQLPEAGRDEWSLGLSARLPLYAGGRRSIERDRSAARLEQTVLADAEVRQGIETRLRAASVELLAAWRRRGLRDDARRETRNALDLAEAAWREGSLDQVALLDARTAARQAALAATEARWQYLQALVHLQRSLGMTPGPMDAAARRRLLGYPTESAGDDVS